MHGTVAEVPDALSRCVYGAIYGGMRPFPDGLDATGGYSGNAMIVAGKRNPTR